MRFDTIVAQNTNASSAVPSVANDTQYQVNSNLVMHENLLSFVELTRQSTQAIKMETSYAKNLLFIACKQDATAHQGLNPV